MKLILVFTVIQLAWLCGTVIGNSSVHSMWSGTHLARNGYEVDHGMVMEKKFEIVVHIADSGYVHCDCKNGTIRIEIPQNNVREVSLNLENFPLCATIPEICVDILQNECSGCKAELTTCDQMKTNGINVAEERVLSAGKKFSCSKKEMNFLRHPVSEFVYYRNTSAVQKPRFRRWSPYPCQMPSSHLLNSEMSCIEYDYKLVCQQRCPYGYTLKEGTTTIKTCIYTEDEWTPRFAQCFRFVDCSINLVNPGIKHCFKGSSTEPAYCKVECYHYEDLPAQAQTTIHCPLDGNWTTMPHCAVQGSAIELVPAPEDLTFPVKDLLSD